MVDRERAEAWREGGDGVDRHELPGARADVEQGQRRRIPLINRIDLEDDPVLVRGRVDRRHLLRAVGGAERALDLIRRDAERGRLVAVDVHEDLWTRDLQV